MSGDPRKDNSPSRVPSTGADTNRAASPMGEGPRALDDELRVRIAEEEQRLAALIVNGTRFVVGWRLCERSSATLGPPGALGFHPQVALGCRPRLQRRCDFSDLCSAGVRRSSPLGS